MCVTTKVACATDLDTELFHCYFRLAGNVDHLRVTLAIRESTILTVLTYEPDLALLLDPCYGYICSG